METKRGEHNEKNEKYLNRRGKITENKKQKQINKKSTKYIKKKGTIVLYDVKDTGFAHGFDGPKAHEGLFFPAG